MTTHRRIFAGHPQELSAVRGWVRQLLNDHPRADEAELIVSELSTNALQHTESGHQAGRFEVALTVAARAVAITVTDSGTRGASRACSTPEPTAPTAAGWRSSALLPIAS
ncbi:hypothetical protein GCM10025734_38460 [Kitasatospora paranensis]|uniref:ATP-binding protein n=1 Tax=Kitasatospora paranensis TaxID=258053 RepID=UPI0031EF1ADE